MDFFTFLCILFALYWGWCFLKWLWRTCIVKPIKWFISLFKSPLEEPQSHTTVAKPITEPKKEEVKMEENLVEKYHMNEIEVTYKSEEGYTEYMLSNLHMDFIYNSPFEIVIMGNDEDTTVSRVSIRDKRKDSEEIYSISFSHLENYTLLSSSIGKYNTDTHKYELFFAISGVPYWEHTYIFGNERIPNNAKSFYECFKTEFLKGNFINLNGNTNYSFYLMFDLLKSKQSGLQSHLINLMEHYPEVKPYCEAEMGKLGMSSRSFNGGKYIQHGYGIYARSGEFPHKDKILEWIKSDEFSSTGMSVYVDNDGTINAIIDESQKLYGNEKYGCKVMVIGSRLPSYIHFGTIDGNFYFTNSGWSSKKNRESGYRGGEIMPHPIESLIGSPIIVKGTFKCESLDITSLEGCPRRVEGDFIAKHNHIDSFIGMPDYIGGTFNIADNEFTDESWEYAKEHIESEFNDYNIRGNRFAKYRKELY